MEIWKEQALHLDVDTLREYQRDYVKLWIDPFYSLEKRNPPHWYNQLLLEAMIDVYQEWNRKMEAENEEFYLKIWLFEPRFIQSQVVVAYREALHFYHHTFKKRENDKAFPFYQFHSLRDKLEQFDWSLHIDSDYYDENDLQGWLEEGLSSEKEISTIKRKASETIKNEYGNHLIYCMDKGDVWIGTLK
ncbi:hypothetical protein AB990_17685 [Alkalihalobacillus pseudalcaliphilus]|nr:hypothetical protein AB990_17685 [Alkalihalobacillus pseudalcaliphilus]